MKLPNEESSLREFVVIQKERLSELDSRVRSGDKSAFRALKMARKELNTVSKELRHQMRHTCDDQWRELIEELLEELA